MSDFNLIPLMPEIFLAITAMGLLILGVFQNTGPNNGMAQIISWTACMALFITCMLILNLDWSAQTSLNNMFVMDRFAAFTKLMILFGLIISIALSVRYLEQEQLIRFEYPVLVMLAGLGMMLMVSANNLLTLYMGLELQSLSLYVLAAFHRNSYKSSEAGVKYFSLGALSSGMLLFGISLIYGYTGSIDFNVIGETLGGVEAVPLGVTFGLVFILAGLAFKISAVPFHMWTPDVYQGAPTSVTALFAIVPKVAAMGLLIRLLFEPFAAMTEDWVQIVYFLSVASMVVGGFAALAQDNLKRLLAYSSIGNMGYALIGIVAGTSEGVGSVLLYLIIYMIMTAGVFGIIMNMRRDGMVYEKIDDLGGLSQTAPFMAYGLAILMFSMSGIPPLAGFFGKLVVFQAAVAEGYYVLAVLGVLTSVVAAYYYLRIVKVMFFDQAHDPFDRDIPFSRRAIIFLSVFFVTFFIFKPSAIIESTQSAASVFFGG